VSLLFKKSGAVSVVLGGEEDELLSTPKNQSPRQTCARNCLVVFILNGLLMRALFKCLRSKMGHVSPSVFSTRK